MPEDRIQTPRVLWASVPLNIWGSEMSCCHRYFEAAFLKTILFIFYYVWRWHIHAVAWMEVRGQFVKSALPFHRVGVRLGGKHL